jgi:hypothetical protein
MFYSSEADALRQFLRDKLGLPASKVPGGFKVQLYQPHYTK